MSDGRAVATSSTPPLKISSEGLLAFLRKRYHDEVPAIWSEQLARYTELLYRWNSRISLTAIPVEEFIELHLAECLLAADKIPLDAMRVLDFGSGTGLPGIPIQIARPELRVTLAESQKKKAAFLREAVRELGLNAKVHAGRVESMRLSEKFDLVALRAVDAMRDALSIARSRIEPGGRILIFTSEGQYNAILSKISEFEWQEPELIPNTKQRILLFGIARG